MNTDRIRRLVRCSIKPGGSPRAFITWLQFVFFHFLLRKPSKIWSKRPKLKIQRLVCWERENNWNRGMLWCNPGSVREMITPSVTSTTQSGSAMNRSGSVAQSSSAMNRSGSVARSGSAMNRSGLVAQSGSAMNRSGSVAQSGSAMNRSGSVAQSGSAMNRSGSVAQSGSAMNLSGSVAQSGSAMNRSGSVAQSGSAMNRSEPVRTGQGRLDHKHVAIGCILQRDLLTFNLGQ